MSTLHPSSCPASPGSTSPSALVGSIMCPTSNIHLSHFFLHNSVDKTYPCGTCMICRMVDFPGIKSMGLTGVANYVIVIIVMLLGLGSLSI